MKKFLRRFVKFSAVPLIFLLVPLYIILASKETLSLGEVIRKQKQDSSVLVGCSLTYIDPYLKAEKSRMLQPDILVLGTSRTMQFRRSFFNPAFSFYNAGGGVAHIHEFLPFLKYTEVKPKVLIIALDQYFFNPHWETLTIPPCSYEYNNSATTILLQNLFQLYRKIGTGKIDWSRLHDSKNIGLLAKIEGDGFRDDGSYFYNQLIKKPFKSPDYCFKDTYHRIEEGRSRFEYGEVVNGEFVEILGELLAYCYQNSIQVVAYLPPYAPAVWKYMTQSEEYKEKYHYLTQIYDSLRPLFEKYHYVLFDFSDGGLVGSRDAEFIDGFHGSEKTYLRMMVEMKRKEETISKFIRDTTELNQLIIEYPDINVAW